MNERPEKSGEASRQQSVTGSLADALWRACTNAVLLVAIVAASWVFTVGMVRSAEPFAMALTRLKISAGIPVNAPAQHGVSPDWGAEKAGLVLICFALLAGTYCAAYFAGLVVRDERAGWAVCAGVALGGPWALHVAVNIVFAGMFEGVSLGHVVLAAVQCGNVILGVSAGRNRTKVSERRDILALLKGIH